MWSVKSFELDQEAVKRENSEKLGDSLSRRSDARDSSTSFVSEQAK